MPPATARRIALLRAVNLAGRNKVAMSDLRDLAARLNLEAPRTLLQSGNLTFVGDERTDDRLEADLEGEIERRLGLATDVLIRTPDEWDEVILGNPFPREAESDPGHLLVVFLKDPPEDARIRALRAAIKGREVVRPGRRHLYVHYPDGVGRSRLTAAVIEKHMGSRGTARNWNTVLRLSALVAD